jgi:PAS domain S-box-containing protein
VTLASPGIREHAPFLPYVFSVIVSAIYGGTKPGMLAALLSLILVPGSELALSSSNQLANGYVVRAGVFAGTATIVVLFNHALRGSRCRMASERKQCTTHIERMSFLLDQVSDGICVTDQELHVSYWNKGAQSLYHRTADEACGEHLYTVIGDAAAPLIDHARQSSANTDTQPHRVISHKTRAGALIIVEVSISPLIDDAGSLCGYVVVSRDSTERARFERELIALHEDLEQRVKERTAELERSNRELDQFAYVASHDLKAPLRAIQLLAEWITEDASASLSPTAAQHLEKLNGRVKRMERLLDDLLAYSRAGRTHQPPEIVDTLTLIQETVELLNLPEGFTIHIPQQLPTMYTERVPLATVFRNLIQNARKHHTHPETGTVTIAAEDLGHAVRFSVADDGPGIPPQYHEQIFELFRTLKPRDQVEGSGMGLSVVKKTVESRGGTISLTSVPGAGATFTFTWPK